MEDLVFISVNSKDGSLEYFLPLLPDNYVEERDRELIGCCNKEGYALGVVELRESLEECEITWIWVAESVRNQGIGHALIDEVIKTHAIELKRIFCQLNIEILDGELCAVKHMDAIYPPVQRLFDDDGRFEAVEVAKRYRITNEEVKNSDVCKGIMEKASGKKVKNTLFFDLSAGMKNVGYDLLEKNNFFVTDRTKFEEECIRDLCFCKTDDTNIIALAICRWDNEKNIELPFAYSTDPGVLMSFTQDFARVVIDKYPGCDFTVTTMNEQAKKIVEYMVGEIEADEVIVEYDWNYDLGMSIEEVKKWDSIV